MADPKQPQLINGKPAHEATYWDITKQAVANCNARNVKPVVHQIFIEARKMGYAQGEAGKRAIANCVYTLSERGELAISFDGWGNPHYAITAGTTGK